MEPVPAGRVPVAAERPLWQVRYCASMQRPLATSSELIVPSLLAIISSKDSRIRVVHKSFPGCVDQAVLVWTAGLVGGTGCGPGVEPNGLSKVALSAGAAGRGLFASRCGLGAPPFLAGAFGAGEKVLINVALSRQILKTKNGIHLRLIT